MRLELHTADKPTFVYGDSVATVEAEVISLWEENKQI